MNFMRRMTDLIVAALALLILTPLLLALAILISVDSPGSPMYSAWRVGRGGRKFRMWKFRTMRAERSEAGPPVTRRDDPRITRVGRILRRTKLDELPQFLNVLAGDMTLVGPRPEAPELLRWYTAAQLAILRVKPGITGVAQITIGEESDYIPDDAAVEEYYVKQLLEPKLRLDLEYLETRTALSDAKVIFVTGVLILQALRGRPLIMQRDVVLAGRGKTRKLDYES